jgi:ribulose-5-phosphate 4-epimerase/fuculose-1-phosphate aldolase
LTNGYFSVFSDLKTLTFEAKLYLGNVPVVKLNSLTVAKPGLVIRALRKNKLVVIKNHGVVCVGERFEDALHLIEVLEESVKIAAVARLFNKKMLDALDKALKKSLSGKGTINSQ